MDIKGYTIIEQLYQSSNSTLYVANREMDNSKVVLKMLSKEHPTPEEVAKFYMEFEICTDLNLDGVISMFSMEKINHSQFMSMELFDGKSLADILLSRKISMEEFFEIAIKITGILGEIHSKNIIHKDINPSNILWNPETKNLKIIDFGISSRLQRETQSAINANGLEGSLYYIAPEQTGRMNRSIDYRSDYYSLGITLYELITGTKPFISEDRLELIHHHIAQIPKPPYEINPDIPKVISDIILKLMSKNAEDRYQSSYGIKTDLIKCFEIFRNSGKIENFEISQNDRSQKLEIPQKLYGREKEIKTLIAGFENVNNFGFCEMMLVKGLSGIGKSALVNEIHKPLVQKRGYFISGKFDQLARNNPYQAIINAFSEMIQQILTENEEQLDIWRRKILDAVGGVGEAITNIIPQLEIIIGIQPELMELEPVKSQKRFNMAFQSFVKVLASKEFPLVIFIDDLQWADSSSLKIIEMFMTDPEMKYIYFIGAYRSNEVHDTHPFILTMEEIKKAGRNIDCISLAPLKFENVFELVSDSFYCNEEKSASLSKICIEKTQGNPFFLSQFLKCLYDENLIKFDSNNGTWNWDIVKIEKKGMTDNVVTLMTEKIQKLPIKTQNVLKLAACWGSTFDLSTLSIVNEKSQIETAQDLWDALTEGLISPIGNNYKLVMGENNDIDVSYKFTHDRVQYTAYTLIEEGYKKQVHFKIGNLMLQNSTKEVIEEKIFDIVNHINIGIDFIVDENEKEKLSKLNLYAGKKAKMSSAYSSSFEYFNVGMQLLNTDYWKKQYDLTLELYSETAEAAYLCGNYNEMTNLIEHILKNTVELLDKLKAYEIKIRSLAAQNRRSEAVNTAIFALNLCGIKIPQKPKIIDLVLGFAKIVMLLIGKKHEDILKKPMLADPVKLAVMRISRVSAASAYFTNLYVWALFGFEEFRISLKYGLDSATIIGYGIYTIILLNLEMIDLGLKRSLVLEKIIEKLGNAEIKPFYLMAYAVLVVHYKIPIKETLPMLMDAYIAGLESGDFEFAGLAVFCHIMHGVAIGANLQDLEKEIAMSENTLIKLNQESSLQLNHIYNQLLLNMLGKSDKPHTLIETVMSDNKELLNDTSTSSKTFFYLLYFNEMYLNFLFYNFEDSIKNSKKTLRYFDGALSLVLIPLLLFYDSLNYLAMYNESSMLNKLKILTIVKINQKRLKKRVKHTPMDYKDKYLLVEAELCRVRGDGIKALQYYNEAVELAKTNEYVNDEALANELIGKFYLSIGTERIAYIYLSESRKCYERWGFKSKVKHLDELYPDLRNFIQDTFKNNTKSSIINSLSTTMRASDLLDLTSVVKASQAISGEIEYVKLIEKLMKVVTENAGAQKIVLLLKNEDKFTVEAEYNIGDKEVIVMEDALKSSTDNENKFSYSIINFVDRTKETFVLTSKNISQFENDTYIMNNKPKSVLCLPFIHQDSLNRILYMENNTTRDAFTHDRIKTLNLLSSQMVISIENASLYKRAVTDGLTQIYNRAFFDNYLMKSVYESQRYNKPLSLLLMDIDHFKKFNDTYGHQIGDLVLKSVAKKIVDAVRKSDLPARYGGEEFIVILPETELKGAITAAEKIRMDIADSIVEYIDGETKIELKVTVSIGVAQLEQNETRISLVERADQHMYKAKEGGRNRVC